MRSGWKRRGRSEEALSRRPGKKPPRRCFLIVCEDAVAAPTYFKALRRALRLSTAEVEICGEECDSAPISVVDFALERRKARKKSGFDYEQIWCVVDVDNHESLHKALCKAKDHGLDVAVSAPCFELWYLLHFVPGGRSYDKCDQLIRDLKAHLPVYEKGTSDPFPELWPKVGDAERHAEMLIKLRDDDRLRNPCTEVHLLVRVLREEANAVAALTRRPTEAQEKVDTGSGSGSTGNDKSGAMVPDHAKSERSRASGRVSPAGSRPESRSKARKP